MREKFLLNDQWSFSKDASSLEKVDASKFLDVSLPHTWNNLDGQDGGGDYYRGRCAYKRTLSVTKEDLAKELYLEFEAVFSISDIYLNRKLAFHHEGGFQTFRIHLNEFLNEGENEILVFADNDVNKKVYPQFADFTFFGGTYRDVHLIKVPHAHFDLDYFGTNGLKITPLKEDEKWNVYVNAYLTNVNDKLNLNYQIFDNDELILELKEPSTKEEVSFNILNPHLWHGRKDPHLYLLKVQLLDENDQILDEVSANFGLRIFKVDPDKGFFLNDESYPLHGVSRHQDRLDLGWALTKKEHEEDMELIKEVGANTIRLAHYQHAQYFYDLCDKEGMIIWAEIPYISAHMDTGRENVFSQMNELILQNYNHPSIVCWGLSNEITMRGESEQLIKDHKDLNDFVHKMDKTRLTTIAEVSMVKMTSEMCKISDIISYNHYFGWYAGSVDQNGPWLDKFHALNPTIPLGLSEYGCEAILDWHSEDPKQGDYSEEYQAYYHEEMLKTFSTRPFLWSTHVWNMFDFAADQRDEGGKKGRNHKGLVTFDRKTKKDSFFIYKAYWDNENKFVHICSKRYEERSKETIKVKVYTNLEEVELFHNDNSLGKAKAIDHKVIFDVTLNPGENTIKAISGEFKDETKFIKVPEENQKYHLNDNDGTIINWFDKEGNPVDFNYPEGYLNIDSPIKDITNTKFGYALINFMIKVAMQKMNMGDGNNDDLLEMVGSMTIRRVSNLALGKKITPQILYAINEIFNKIPVLDTKDEPKVYSKKVSYLGENQELEFKEGYLSVESKVKELLKTQIGNAIYVNLLPLVKDNKKFKITKFRLFVLKQLTFIKLLNLIKKVPASYLTDINNILGNIKK